MRGWLVLTVLVAGCSAFGASNDDKPKPVDVKPVEEAGSQPAADAGDTQVVDDSGTDAGPQILPECLPPSGATFFDDLDGPGAGPSASFPDDSHPDFTFDSTVKYCGTGSLHVTSTRDQRSYTRQLNNRATTSLSWTFLFYVDAVTPSSTRIEFATLNMVPASLAFYFKNGNVNAKDGLSFDQSLGTIVFKTWQRIDVDLKLGIGASATIRLGDPKNPAPVVTNQSIQIQIVNSEDLGLNQGLNASVDIHFDRDSLVLK
jgi:hypothetical protein